MVSVGFVGMLVAWAVPVLVLAGEMDKTVLEGATWQ